MHPMRRRLGFSSAFTLIELLVVIAIIAILAVVVVLTLNPAQLLAQSRDANRLSDLATMNSAVNLYNVDQAGGSTYSLGIASTTYISVFDPSATTTAGTNCSTIGVPAVATGWTYHCAASSTYRSVASTTGWIPIAFSTLSAGVPFGSLPVDPANTISSFSYYTFQTGGNSQYELTVPLESTKYMKQNLLLTSPDPAKVAAGTGSGLIAQEEGLMLYWPMDEGSGSSTIDASGNNNLGTWNGTAAGLNSTYYTAPQVGPSAGYFNGINDYIAASISPLSGNVPFTISAWFYLTGDPSNIIELFTMGNGNVNSIQLISARSQFRSYINGVQAFWTPAIGSSIPLNQWVFIAWTFNSGSYQALYVNNTVQTNGYSLPGAFVPAQGFVIGSDPSNSGRFLQGKIDDARMYNRALSPAEIQAIYNAEK